MRFEMAGHAASSVLNVLRMFQDVVNQSDLHPAKNPIHPLVQATPNLTGCVDSPEAATIVLMLVGTLGLYYGSSLYLRHARRRATTHAGV